MYFTPVPNIKKSSDGHALWLKAWECRGFVMLETKVKCNKLLILIAVIYDLRA